MSALDGEEGVSGTATGSGESSQAAAKAARDAKHEKLWELLDREPNIDLSSLTKAFAHHLEYTVCKYRDTAHGPDIYQALAFTVRDFLIDRWNQTQTEIQKKRSRRLYYISMEFLMGRLLDVNLVNTGMREQATKALEEFGFDLSEIRGTTNRTPDWATADWAGWPPVFSKASPR